MTLEIKKPRFSRGCPAKLVLKQNYQLMLNQSWRSSFTSWIASTNRRIRVEELISFSGFLGSFSLFTGGRRAQRRPFCALCMLQSLNEKQGKTSNRGLQERSCLNSTKSLLGTKINTYILCIDRQSLTGTSTTVGRTLYSTYKKNTKKFFESIDDSWQVVDFFVRVILINSTLNTGLYLVIQP